MTVELKQYCDERQQGWHVLTGTRTMNWVGLYAFMYAVIAFKCWMSGMLWGLAAFIYIECLAFILGSTDPLRPPLLR
jgi:hypothetical protein